MAQHRSLGKAGGKLRPISGQREAGVCGGEHSQSLLRRQERQQAVHNRDCSSKSQILRWRRWNPCRDGDGTRTRRRNPSRPAPASGRRYTVLIATTAGDESTTGALFPGPAMFGRLQSTLRHQPHRNPGCLTRYVRRSVRDNGYDIRTVQELLGHSPREICLCNSTTMSMS